MDLQKICTGLAREEEATSTRLLKAVAAGELAAVEQLLAARADATCRNAGDRRTPLHLAVTMSGGSPACVVALLEAGASPAAPDAEGNTPWSVGNEAVKIEMLRPRKKVNQADFAPPLPKGIEGFLKSQSLTAHNGPIALWCHLEGRTSVPELLEAPHAHLEAMGLGKSALQRLEAARQRLGGR
eukprot:gnl/TRDRNA2_/TRDRNA2_44106_c0_seq1.p1 gnl/TRDRNA2_/TRDRNA2_44106_c0~~gnl/TRDRNA2_/TRDRNA2_44106_c0_seq1.p1  ORF type:complete len:184 (+),score=39.73 gnl/TRDRNA2_/TRDRNA2_44106_c0_seq1:60-611(+)